MLYHMRTEQVGVSQFSAHMDQEHKQHTQQKRDSLTGFNLLLRVIASTQRSYCIEVKAHNEGCTDEYRWLPVPLCKPEIESYVCHAADLSHECVIHYILYQGSRVG